MVLGPVSLRPASSLPGSPWPKRPNRASTPLARGVAIPPQPPSTSRARSDAATHARSCARGCAAARAGNTDRRSPQQCCVPAKRGYWNRPGNLMAQPAEQIACKRPPLVTDIDRTLITQGSILRTVPVGILFGSSFHSGFGRTQSPSLKRAAVMARPLGNSEWQTRHSVRLLLCHRRGRLPRGSRTCRDIVRQRERASGPKPSQLRESRMGRDVDASGRNSDCGRLVEGFRGGCLDCRDRCDRCRKRGRQESLDAGRRAASPMCLADRIE